MSDAAFKGADYPGYTLATLRAWLEPGKGRPDVLGVDVARVRAEIARRERVAAGDRAAMTPAERLRGQ